MMNETIPEIEFMCACDSHNNWNENWECGMCEVVYNEGGIVRSKIALESLLPCDQFLDDETRLRAYISIYNHESLHIVLHSIGEIEAAHKWDNLKDLFVEYGIGCSCAYWGKPKYGIGCSKPKSRNVKKPLLFPEPIPFYL